MVVNVLLIETWEISKCNQGVRTYLQDQNVLEESCNPIGFTVNSLKNNVLQKDGIRVI